jgi:hypothetical protein
LSTWITRDVLRLPKPSLLERYSHIFFAFTFSGILHITIDKGERRPGLATRMLFFQSSAIGIILEDGVQALWRRFFGEKFIKIDAEVPRWKKLIGYIWVWSFFIVVSPWSYYPTARQPAGIIFKEIPEIVTDQTAVITLGVLSVVLLFLFKAET